MLGLNDGWCLVMSFGLLVCIISAECLADPGRMREDTPRAPGRRHTLALCLGQPDSMELALGSMHMAVTLSPQ